MREYNVNDLRLIGIPRDNDTYQYFIVLKKKENKYIEIFTKKEIILSEDILLEDLAAHYSIFEIYNYLTHKPLLLSKQELFEKYNEINYIKTLLEHDETMVKDKLSDRGIYQKSRIYINTKKL